jgi:hypothetical protein
MQYDFYIVAKVISDFFRIITIYMNLENCIERLAIANIFYGLNV